MAGYKTYIVAVATLLVTLAYIFKYIDRSQFEQALGILLSAGMATTRLAVDKVEKEVKKNGE